MTTAQAINVTRPFCYQWEDILVDADIHPLAKLLGFVLVRYMNDKKSYCFPSITRLVQQTRLTKKTVIKYLRELSKAGLLQIRKRIIDGQFTSNVYQLIKPMVKKQSKINEQKVNAKVYDIHQGSVSDGGGVVYDVHPNNQLNNQMNNQVLKTYDQKSLLPDQPKPVIKKPSDNNERLTKLFTQFWNGYPKKVGRKYAQQIFFRINPDDELFRCMMNALSQFNAFQWRDTDKQYIPNASTWLNQERWNDEIACTQAKPLPEKKGAEKFREAVRKYMNKNSNCQGNQ